MRLGLVELLLVLAIGTLVFGPAVYGWVRGWLRRAKQTNREIARRRAQAQAQMRAERDAVLHRFQIVGLVLAVLMALSLVYALLLRPIDPRPQSYTAPAVATETAVRNLSGLTELSLEGYTDPGCVRVREGWVYLSVQSEAGGSAILRMREDGSSLTRVLESEGEITGFDFDPAGEIWFSVLTGKGGMICRGSYDGWGASTEKIVTQIDGEPLPCPAAVAVGADGRVYFANLSASVAGDGLENALRTELLAHTATGQVYVYDPAARTVQLVLEGVAGAAGLAFVPEENALYVSDFGQRCIWKVDADARELTAGGRDCALFAGALPGYPGALGVDDEGSLWVAYRFNRSPWREGQAAETFQRGVALRLPYRMQTALFGVEAGSPAAQEYSSAGQLLAEVPSENGGGAAALCPVGSRLYLGGSDAAPVLGWLLY